MENYSIVSSSLTGNTKSCQSADRSVYRDLTLQQRKISSIIL